MGQLTIIKPVVPTAVTAASSGVASAANALTQDPKEVWVAPVTSALTVDLGGLMIVDAVFVGAFTGPIGSRWRATFATAADFSDAVNPVSTRWFVPAPDNGQTSDAILMPPVLCRYVRLDFTAPPGVAGTMALGLFCAGRSFTTTWPQEWGSGRQPLDMSTVEQLGGGGFGINRRGRKSLYQWSFGDLTPAETDTLHEIALDLGSSAPVVVVEDYGPPAIPIDYANTASGIAGAGSNAVTITRTGPAVAGWSAAAYSDAACFGCVVQCSIATLDQTYAIGFADAPGGLLTDGNPKAALYVAGATASFMLDGSAIEADLKSLGEVAVGDVATLIIQPYGAAACYLNGVLKLTTPIEANTHRHLSAQLYSVGCAISDAVFQPLSSSRGIHYGLFRSLAPYSRANALQTRWDLKVEEWV